MGDTYRHRDLEVEEPHAEHEADNNADARREVLSNVVRVVDTQARQDSPDSLEYNRRPDHPVVPVEKAVLRNLFAVVKHDPHEEGRE